MSEDRKIASLALELVSSRAVLAKLKRERAACPCEAYSKPDPADYYHGDPACWTVDGLTTEEMCETCQKRALIQPKVEAASKAATKAWLALKRAVKKYPVKS